MIERQIPFEICVTSNLQTQTVSDIKKHPLPKFYKDGLMVTLNTDDRGVSCIDMTHEYGLINRELGFSFEDCAQLVLNGVDALFLEYSQKNQLRNGIKDELKQLRKKMTEGR